MRAFRKELKKLKETIKSGSGEEEIYKPSLWYFDLLLFTKDQEEPTESLNNMGSDADESNSEFIAESQEVEEADNTSTDQEKEVSTIVVI